MPPELNSSLKRMPGEGESLSTHKIARKKGDYVIDPKTGCWNWQKTLVKGYGTGRFRSVGIDTNHAHRAYYIAANGHLEPTTHVHHKCKNRRCVNPDHLEAVASMDHFALHKLMEKTGLTLEDVERIRWLGTQPGVRAKEVAFEYGISWRTVDDYWSGERHWTDQANGASRPQGRICKQCGGLIAPALRRQAIYCSPACREFHNNNAGRRARLERAA